MAGQMSVPWGRAFVKHGVRMKPVEDLPANSLAMQKVNSKAFTIAVDDVAKARCSIPWACPGSPECGLEYPWNVSDYAYPPVYATK
jgi:hypothetical protein